MKLTEKQLFIKFDKIIEKSDDVTENEYRAIFFFIKDLKANNINVNDILKKEWNKKNEYIFRE